MGQELLDRFRKFVSEFTLVEEDRPLPDFPDKTYRYVGMHHQDGLSYYDHTYCNGSFHDFNRDILHPGFSMPNESRMSQEDIEYANKARETGVLQIRMDDNFWVVASFPYEFKDLKIEDIVSTVWPDVVDPIFMPDSDDHEAWRKHFDSPDFVTVRRIG